MRSILEREPDLKQGEIAKMMGLTQGRISQLRKYI
ncbi:sigma factor-like helix-turn-helix DNA-binding protein [Paenibacillus sp. D51F]